MVTGSPSDTGITTGSVGNSNATAIINDAGNTPSGGAGQGSVRSPSVGAGGSTGGRSVTGGGAIGSSGGLSSSGSGASGGSAF